MTETTAISFLFRVLLANYMQLLAPALYSQISVIIAILGWAHLTSDWYREPLVHTKTLLTLTTVSLILTNASVSSPCFLGRSPFARGRFLKPLHYAAEARWCYLLTKVATHCLAGFYKQIACGLLRPIVHRPAQQCRAGVVVVNARLSEQLAYVFF